MKTLKLVPMLLILVFTVYNYSAAQYSVARGVFGNGGTAQSTNDYRLVGTTGQSTIGNACNTSNNHYSGFWYITITIFTKVESVSGGFPLHYDLAQNYPNPFNPSTAIRYQLPVNCQVEVSIYNPLGQKVVTLVSEKQQPGYYHVIWNAAGFSCGVYFCRIETEAFVRAIKLALVK